MKYCYACMICAGWLAVVASVPADIVWSGEQNLSGFEQYIDLNSDSLTDVFLIYSLAGDNSLPPVISGGFLSAKVDGFGVDGSNRILVDSDSSDPFDHAALPAGSLISSTPDASHEWMGGMFAAGLVSYWRIDPPNADTEWRGILGENGNTYVGISFDVEDSTHYGWINIALGEEGPHGFEMPITTSWAYESTQDTPITAGAIPEPSTGILTVGGSLSLLLLARSRRRKQYNTPLPKSRNPHGSTTPGKW